jgi:hypothetical protein
MIATTVKLVGYPGLDFPAMLIYMNGHEVA